jgi:hypothetical protein
MECRKVDQFLETKCLHCDNTFKVAKSRYEKWGHRGKCCSPECLKRYQESLKEDVLIRREKKCDNCQTIFYRFGDKKKYNFCSRKCSTEYMVGDKSHSYKGGTITAQGYKAIKLNGKYRLEHRLIMEEHLGRKLEPGEQVHHVDGDKLNNSIENLDIIDIVDHGRMHANQRWNKEDE